MINLDVSPTFDEFFLSFTIDEALDVALDVCLEFTLELTLEVTVSISSMEPTLHITSFMAALKLINSQLLGTYTNIHLFFRLIQPCWQTYDQSIASSKTKYIKLNTKTQIFFNNIRLLYTL